MRRPTKQEEEKELQTNPDQVYFTNSSESYAWYDQNSLSWKTWQRSLITDWTSFSESFPKQGTMQNGQLYLQVHWEQHIEEADRRNANNGTLSSRSAIFDGVITNQNMRQRGSAAEQRQHQG